MSEIFIFLLCLIGMCIIAYICGVINNYYNNKESIYARTIEMLDKLPREYGEHYIKRLYIYKDMGQYVIMYKPAGFVTRGDTLFEAVKMMYDTLIEFKII